MYNLLSLQLSIPPTAALNYLIKLHIKYEFYQTLIQYIRIEFNPQCISSLCCHQMIIITYYIHIYIISGLCLHVSAVHGEQC